MPVVLYFKGSFFFSISLAQVFLYVKSIVYRIIKEPPVLNKSARIVFQTCLPAGRTEEASSNPVIFIFLKFKNLRQLGNLPTT